jgi:predicted ribosome quality control (RQC) complex YloA/Tae2 family protein
MEPVDVDIGLSGYANARRYYETKKTSAVKEAKTLHANVKALQSAERKIRHELQSVKAPTPGITKIRKPFWF